MDAKPQAFLRDWHTSAPQGLITYYNSKGSRENHLRLLLTMQIQGI
jgi:hypothetical protein